MRWRSSLLASLVVLAAAVCIPTNSAAQGNPDIFVTPVPNAPFSAVVNIERSVIQRDGSVFQFRSIREIGRDSRGRIHNESRAIIPISSSDMPQLIRVHLYDPQTRISTWLDPRERVFWSQTMNHPPSAVPPALRYAAPADEGLPQNEFAEQEDLGIHEMEGVSAHGIRETQTIAAESNGTGKEITITDEYWYSNDLRINLIVIHSDPRSGTVTLTVSQVSRTEPNFAFFEIPEGYKPRGGQAAAR
jgi:hypothetical protein